MNIYKDGTRFADGEKMIYLVMCHWVGTGHTPDCSMDVINYSHYDYDLCAYIVDSVDDVIDYVEDWLDGEDEDTLAHRDDAIESMINEYMTREDAEQFYRMTAGGYLDAIGFRSARWSVVDLYDEEDL